MGGSGRRVDIRVWEDVFENFSLQIFSGTEEASTQNVVIVGRF